jgi:hypothetical protein
MFRLNVTFESVGGCQKCTVEQSATRAGVEIVGNDSLQMPSVDGIG